MAITVRIDDWRDAGVQVQASAPTERENGDPLVTDVDAWLDTSGAGAVYVLKIWNGTTWIAQGSAGAATTGTVIYAGLAGTTNVDTVSAGDASTTNSDTYLAGAA